MAGRKNWIESSNASFWETLKYIPAIYWIIAGAIVVASAAYYEARANLARIQCAAHEAEVVRFAQRSLAPSLYPIVSDVLFAAENPIVVNALKAENESSRQEAGALLLRWCRWKADYFKVRLFNLAGNEVVRVDNSSGQFAVVSRPHLQNKSSRYFFQRGIALNKEQAFVSPLDLNVEHDLVETPPHPTIRICAPVFDNHNRKVGLVVVNFEGERILSQLHRGLASSRGQIQLLNLDGYWLKGPTEKDEWGFMYPARRELTFEKRYPSAWAQIRAQESGAFYDNGGLYTFDTVHPITELNGRAAGPKQDRPPVPSNEAYVWKVVSFIPHSALVAESRYRFWQIVLGDLVLLTVLAVVGYTHTRVRLRQRRVELEVLQQGKILDLANDAIYVVDTGHRIIYWNEGAVRQYGWTKSEALGHDPMELLHSRFPEPLPVIEQKLFENGSWEGEVVRISRDGKEGVSLSTWALQRDAKGKPQAALVINRDITVRKRALDDLREAHRESELFFNAVPCLLIGLDAPGKIVRWNHAAAATFGLSGPQVFGKTLGTCGITWLEDDTDARIAAVEANDLGRLGMFRYVVSGITRVCEMSLLPVCSSNGEVAGFLIVGDDITDRITLEQQLRQAQKLEAIGQLAAGIAHEINTPTQYVGDNTLFLKQSWSDLQKVINASMAIKAEADSGSVSSEVRQAFEEACASADLEYLLEEMPKALEQSLEGVSRITKIVSAMKEFSHPGSQEKKTVDINRAIETTVTVARNEWKYVADVETHFDPNLPLVPCFAGELNQVILNLLVNAAHAIEARDESKAGAKGLIKISTRRDEGSVEINIADTGAGIPEEIRSRVFEPFFTTKEVGKGTGQGLAFAHTVIAKKHSGNIWFDSTLGEGTVFHLRLPLGE